MEDSQTLGAKARPVPIQDPVDRAPRDDLERQVLPEKSESTSTPQASNLASAHQIDVLALKYSKYLHS